jgi:hypothetical protein
MLVKQVGSLERLEQVCGVAAGGNADSYAAAHHLKSRGASDCIAHVAFGVVQQIDFAVVDLDTCAARARLRRIPRSRQHSATSLRATRHRSELIGRLRFYTQQKEKQNGKGGKTRRGFCSV